MGVHSLKWVFDRCPRVTRRSPRRLGDDGHGPRRAVRHGPALPLLFPVAGLDILVSCCCTAEAALLALKMHPSIITARFNHELADHASTSYEVTTTNRKTVYRR
ncbi:hypothetical protein PAHAL_3G326800 [Panicum hallii]|uniref:Uncharacterized protein n=1 Tax=Panicum hallii TaxID=206008 RepID=A0A2T8KKA7_9POAL|nr:hypothetical protein PAHAL_3G326800 [Panicum hallii]